MDSELLSAMENLQFTEEKSTNVVTETTTVDEDTESWLVGSVITLKPVNGDSVVCILRSVWKAKNVTEIVELRPNFFLIKPVSAEAKDMILKRRPWLVHDDFFSIESFNPIWCADEYDFNSMAIWIRVYKLPLRAMNIEMGLRLGGCVGKALGNELSSYIMNSTGLDVKKLQYGSWLRVLDQKPHTASHKRQGVEYFIETSPAPPGSANAETELVPHSVSQTSYSAGSSLSSTEGTHDSMVSDSTVYGKADATEGPSQIIAATGSHLSIPVVDP
ncbi:hypothetical protein V6N12_050362 [Hibiscus sabdariffa]|uniref:DUF4283 domain-containing protein n=1 Tax=Hibiscus sabdariffa TaxID=183260 RepID=A0ABR2GC84_9ROSI